MEVGVGTEGRARALPRREMAVGDDLKRRHRQRTKLTWRTTMITCALRSLRKWNNSSTIWSSSTQNASPPSPARKFAPSLMDFVIFGVRRKSNNARCSPANRRWAAATTPHPLLPLHRPTSHLLSPRRARSATNRPKSSRRWKSCSGRRSICFIPGRSSARERKAKPEIFGF